MKEICKLFKSSKKEDKASSLSLSLFTPGKSFSYVNNEEKFNMIMKNLTKEKEKKKSKPRTSTLVKKKEGEEENLLSN
jgi:hypothetical protein